MINTEWIKDLIGNAARRQVTGMQPNRYIDVVLPVYMIPLPLCSQYQTPVSLSYRDRSPLPRAYSASDVEWRKKM
jgi:hypothetical protein